MYLTKKKGVIQSITTLKVNKKKNVEFHYNHQTNGEI